MAERKVPRTARKRRARNPRAMSVPDPTHGGNRRPSVEEVLEVSRETLADARSMIESVATAGEVDASLKEYLLRVVAQLEILHQRATDSEDELEIFAHAWSTFTPVLEMDWLPEDPRSFTPDLSKREQQCVEMLRHERQLHAAKRQGKTATGPWDGLIDLISESLEIFMVFGYRAGVEGCFGLNEALALQAERAR